MSRVSVWSQVCNMAPEVFENVYGEFPQRVRHLLGDRLENEPWEFINATDEFSPEIAKLLLQKLVQEIELLSRSCESEQHMILQCANNVKAISQRDPMTLVKLFKHIVESERSLVLQQFPRLTGSFIDKQEGLKFNFRTIKIQHMIKQAVFIQDQMRHTKESLPIHEQMPRAVNLQRWASLVNESLESLDNAQIQVIKRINIWKRQQQLSGNGAPFDENLLPLQERLETLFNIYNDIFRLVQSISQTEKQMHSGLVERINKSLDTLIRSSFLVDKQPPQVLKTQTKFQASINFLLGSKVLSGFSKMPTVKALIITEKKAQELFQSTTGDTWNDGTGEIDNGKSILEITPTTKSCGALFKNMLLKKIKRCERKGSESVTEEKCAILFMTDIMGTNGPCHLRALSLPLVVIVHGNQDNNAKATILWDNAFSEMDRRPFFVEEKVPWSRMCQTLNMKFVSEVGTKHQLCNKHFLFLAQKIFNENSLNEKDFKDRNVSWAQFNKELLRERNFTFWQWFDGVVELTKKWLKSYWSDGLIIGFISKQYVHNLLINEHDGTFLLRFSDSEIGGISIAHILRGEDGSAQIQNIQPFTAKDLSIRSLGDRVRDLKQLKFLYNGKLKDEAFEKYYTKETELPNGYKKATIQMKLDREPEEENINKMDTLPGKGMYPDITQIPTMQPAMFPSSPIASPPLCIPVAMSQPQFVCNMQLPVLQQTQSPLQAFPSYTDNARYPYPEIDPNLAGLPNFSVIPGLINEDTIPMAFPEEQTLQNPGELLFPPTTEDHSMNTDPPYQQVLDDIYQMENSFNVNLSWLP
ncbi:signal transducer and activator of transcription 6 isoform X2 [Bombina bombina]|uniref:signal transducer and activator of transcription 6 isoform X2 n=1 Tax=Bombina bombina TaxID=8345 RepID=UPI00235A85BF|nr:signal transducer and activator of transcription 6 isoform X2 [Bombina bombina]